MHSLLLVAHETFHLFSVFFSLFLIFPGLVDVMVSLKLPFSSRRNLLGLLDHGERKYCGFWVCLKESGILHAGRRMRYDGVGVRYM